MSKRVNCAWCEQSFERPHDRGPAPKYCSASHRQEAYRARRASTEGIRISSQLVTMMKASSGAWGLSDEVAAAMKASSGVWGLSDEVAAAMKVLTDSVVPFSAHLDSSCSFDLAESGPDGDAGEVTGLLIALFMLMALSVGPEKMARNAMALVQILLTLLSREDSASEVFHGVVVLATLL